MEKILKMKLLPLKETKGCFRYGFESGDNGIATLYIRKEHVVGKPPKAIQVQVFSD